MCGVIDRLLVLLALALAWAEALGARGHRVAEAGEGLPLAAPLPTVLP